MDAYLGDQGSRLRGFLTRLTLEMTDVCRDTVKCSIDKYVAMLAAPARSTVDVKSWNELTVAAAAGAKLAPPAPVLSLRLRVSRAPQVLNSLEIA